MRASPAPTLLLVEDDPTDVGLIREALGRLAPGLHVHAVRTTIEALAYCSTSTPTCVLLDLLLPDRSGLAFLSAFKGDPDTRRVPVVVLSAARADYLVWKAYWERANAFLVKPDDADGLDVVLGALVHFWFGVALRASHGFTR